MVIRSNFSFSVFHFSMKILQANRLAPDGTPRFSASHLGLFCLPMSRQKDARLIWGYTRGDQKVRGKVLLNRIALIDCNENSQIYLRPKVTLHCLFIYLFRIFVSDI